LGGGSEEELVLSTKRTSQPQSVEAQDALEIREQHLDLFPFTACMLCALVGNALGLFGAGVYLHEVVTANGWTTGLVSGTVTLPALNESGRKKP
jgi:hypothetical protein